MNHTALESLGLIEITGLASSLVVLDALEKASGVRVLQAELNDQLGALLKISGTAAAVKTAVDHAIEQADRLKVRIVHDIINAPDARTWPIAMAEPEFNAMLESDVVFIPHARGQTKEQPKMSDNQPFALGLIETQGLTAVLEALDTAAKAANVQFVCREKLGGGYVTIILKGDVAAVKAAVEAGKAKVGDLGKLIAAHVIARPSEAVLSLLPKS
jgi:microcompartment protein CcmL/EutN